MKVVYDHQIFSFQRVGGASRYFQEIITRLGSEAGFEGFLPFRLSDNRHLAYCPGFRPSAILGNSPFWGRGRLLASLNRVTSSINLLAGKYDLLHPTYYHPYFLRLLRGKPFVLTVYDMIHELFPEQFLNGGDIRPWKKLLVDKAAAIIAISDQTKEDIVRLYHVPDRKIHVIHLCDSFSGIKAAASGGEAASMPFFLFVGRREGYKNFSFLIRALAPLIRGPHTARLVCVGGGAFSDTEAGWLSGLGIENQVAQMEATDAELASLYSRAVAFIFPSMYEGFGIPILEAFRCGCPVLLSRASCFPDIAGDAGLYFDPESAGDLESAARKILDDASLREGLVLKGRNRLGSYSWEKAVRQTMQVYETVLG